MNNIVRECGTLQIDNASDLFEVSKNDKGGIKIFASTGLGSKAEHRQLSLHLEERDAKSLRDYLNKILP